MVTEDRDFPVICPTCGKGMGSLALFCNKCGTELPPNSNPVDLEEGEREEILRVFCEGLGHKIQTLLLGSVNFCPFCGANLGANLRRRINLDSMSPMSRN